jgi:hypothetical protein
MSLFPDGFDAGFGAFAGGIIPEQLYLSQVKYNSFAAEFHAEIEDREVRVGSWRTCDASGSNYAEVTIITACRYDASHWSQSRFISGSGVPRMRYIALTRCGLNH